MNSYNLIDILSNEVQFETNKYNFSGIQIPMIQRDYAQGRVGEGVIRKRFLEAIFEALTEKKDLELDFVYGAKKTIDSKDFFIPLDGQQRLTTLYLLYWYIGNRELEEDKLIDLRNILKRFSYATRPTSDKFCETLSTVKISFKINPSEEIINSSWFFDSFKLDPTVQSMLVMLDEIHKIYLKINKDLYLNLNQIKFYVLPLDGFDLTDELYIKMNARGKQLTDFENLKADLIKWMKNEKNPFKVDFDKVEYYDGRAVKYHLYFDLKLDNHWTKLFWEFSKKNEKTEKKLVDPYMLQFWNRYILNTYITNSNLNNNAYEEDDYFKELYGNQGNDNEFKYNNFDIYKAILEKNNSIQNIEKVFESLYLHIEEINEIIKPSWKKNDEWFMFSENINQRQRILFFAVTRYLELNSFIYIKFKNWIRVVWNIIIDPNIRSVQAMVGAMKYINQLAEKSDDIYKFLENPNSVLFSSNTTYQAQLEEEYFKAILINKSENWEPLIIKAESHPLFQGNIRFLLIDDSNTDIEAFKKNYDISYSILENNDLTDKNENYLWIRALLAKSIDIVLPITLSNGRFNNWRYLINASLMKPMRFLIESIATSTNNIEDILEEICSNYIVDPSQIWVYPLVTWKANNGNTLLGNYSDTRKVQEYNYYTDEPNNAYLYNQNKWTEGNVLLSNNRNKMISALLQFSNDILPVNVNRNIENTFYKGWNVLFFKIAEDVRFTYFFDRSFVKIGIMSDPELEVQMKSISFNSNEIENGWICRLKYDFTQIEVDKTNEFFEKINWEVFHKKNPNSLLSKITL
jgi:hypothetical protein